MNLLCFLSFSHLITILTTPTFGCSFDICPDIKGAERRRLVLRSPESRLVAELIAHRQKLAAFWSNGATIQTRGSCRPQGLLPNVCCRLLELLKVCLYKDTKAQFTTVQRPSLQRRINTCTHKLRHSCISKFFVQDWSIKMFKKKEREKKETLPGSFPCLCATSVPIHCPWYWH